MAARRWSATRRASALPRRVPRRRRRGAARRATVAARRARALEPRRALPLGVGVARSCRPTSSGCSSTCCCAARRRRSRPTRAAAAARARAGFAAADLSLGEYLELQRARSAQAVLGARTLDARDFHEDGSAIAVRGRRRRARQARRPRRRDAAQGARHADERASTAAAPPTRCATRSSTSSSSASPRRCPARRAATTSALVAHARTIEAEADRRLAAADGARDRLRPRRPSTPDERVRHEQERLEAVFGRGFRALPLVRPGERRRARHRVRAARTSCTAATRSQALSWLQGVSRVRPGASRLSGALDVRRRAPAHVGARAAGRAAAVGRGRALGRRCRRRRPARAAAGQALARRPPAAAVPGQRAARRARDRRVGRARARRAR